jgi:nicotinamidase-related amidase
MKKMKLPKDAWRINIKQSALVVVDMVRTFVDEDTHLKCIGAKECVPRINQLAALPSPVLQHWNH